MLIAISFLLSCGQKELDSAVIDTDSQNPIPVWEVIEDEDQRGAWLNILAPNPQDIWIVGGQPEEGKVLRGNPKDGWMEMEVPANTPLLNWASGTSDHMWVVGLQGSILEWTNDRWIDHSQDIDEAFWGIYAHSNGDIVAVGGSSRWGGENAVIFHYDGSSWSQIPIPEVLSSLSNLFKVTFDGDDYWMVGTAGSVLYGSLDNLVALPTGITQDIITVLPDPIDSQDVLMVGGRGVGLYAEGLDGNLSTPQQMIAGINGVAASEQDTLLVGEMGYATFWNRQAQQMLEVSPMTRNILHAATVVTQENGVKNWYAVGGNLATAESQYQGSILMMEYNP